MSKLSCVFTGVTPVHRWFRPWTPAVKLDAFHFMRRFTRGCTTEHHPLYGTFCHSLTACIFEWDKDDYERLKQAKKSELVKKTPGHVPTDAEVLRNITSSEKAKYCRRTTNGVQKCRDQIQRLLDSSWELTDSAGVPLINKESMSNVWKAQQKHLGCIQDPVGVPLYTKTGVTVQKGNKTLDVLRCARGSSSLESFHKHQCSFIPGTKHSHVIFFLLFFFDTRFKTNYIFLS